MKEIQFRAWDKKKEEMIFFEGIDFCSEYNLLSFGADDVDCLYGKEIEDCEIMQYTGLKDKNGKEIYEGDTVKENGDNDLVYPVVFEQGGFWMKDRFENENGWPEQEDMEIIGNIYENPDLTH